MFGPLTLGKVVGIRSKHLRIFRGSRRQSSSIFGKFRKMFGNVRVALRQPCIILYIYSKYQMYLPCHRAGMHQLQDDFFYLYAFCL